MSARTTESPLPMHDIQLQVVYPERHKTAHPQFLGVHILRFSRQLSFRDKMANMRIVIVEMNAGFLKESKDAK